MQAAAYNDIGLVIATDKVSIDIPSSVLDTSTLGTNDDSTITFEINDADSLVESFQIEDDLGNVLSGAIELNINVTTAGVTKAITEFDNPIEVTIQLTSDLIGEVNPENLTMYWYPETGEPEAMETTYNVETMELTFTTMHFSIFVLIEDDVADPMITIESPQEYEVLPIGTVITFNAADDFTSVDDITLTAILDNGMFELPIYSGFTPEAGVYTLTIEAEDLAGNKSNVTRDFVIYNPDGGFVTGGGWINSPAGAYKADPALTGKVSFGFVSKYKKGATVPTGQTTFKFKIGDIEFKSTGYEWLAISEIKAEYKGIGEINGQGNYGIILTAIDSDKLINSNEDIFIIKIWDKESYDLIYDNQLDTDVSVYTGKSGTILQGGNIIVH